MVTPILVLPILAAKVLYYEKGIRYCMAETKEYQKAIDYLFKMIEDNELSIGDKLPTERKMSETLGIGRNSIREALKILEHLGMIECRQGSGNYLTANMSGTISNCMEMLLLLRQTNGKEVISFRREMELIICKTIMNGNTIGRWCDKLAEIIPHDWEQLPKEQQVDLDVQFHYTLIQASENMMWICISEAIALMYRKWINMAVLSSRPDVLKQIHDTHHHILNALVNNDWEACEQAVNAHYNLVDTLSDL